jgi:FkbM family methyltransferase
LLQSLKESMIKQLIRRLAQGLLGFENYLVLFSWFSGQRVRFMPAEKEFRFFMGLIPAQGIILDIGANIGIMSVALAKHLPQAIIYAFEPMPANLRALERILRYYRLKQVHIMPYALGDQSSRVQMLMPEIDRAKMQGYSHVLESGQSPQTGETFEVPMYRLDDLVELQTTVPVTAIKIDVENYEYFVLKGGESLIRKHRPIIYAELWDDARRGDCMALLTGLGYGIHVYQDDELVIFTDQPVTNFFFLPHPWVHPPVRR